MRPAANGTDDGTAAPQGPFERLLGADRGELLAVLHELGPPHGVDWEERLGAWGRRVGLSAVRMLCALGFNPLIQESVQLPQLLGFSTPESLVARRNAAFVNDVYRELSVDDVLAVHATGAAGGGERRAEIAGLAQARISNIEQQLESTINPVLVGGYKLEVRSLYEHGLAGADFVAYRLRPVQQVLRGITDEVLEMARSGVRPARALLDEPGVTLDEKRKLVAHGLVSADALERWLASAPVSEHERQVLRAAARG